MHISYLLPQTCTKERIEINDVHFNEGLLLVRIVILHFIISNQLFAVLCYSVIFTR